MAIIKTIHVKNIQVYIERDADGYISLSTDAWQPGALDPIIEAIRSLQDDDDREMDNFSGGPGARPSTVAAW